MKKIELLAPAGDLRKLKYALEFGADAVYCGVPDFSLRVRINKFTWSKVRQGIEYAHGLGKKCYVTINVLAHNRHLKKLESFKVSAKGGSAYGRESLKLKVLKMADGIIVADPGVLRFLKKKLPKQKFHLSTQANCTNWQSAKFWYEQGVSRIILGREVTLKEIKEIHKKVPKVELEYFVHGAMCMSYSGRCFLSKLYLDRSANLGDCVQPCRWEYLTEVKRPDEILELEQDQHGSYIFNSKDLCLIEYLEKLKQSGVSSFKIEGRAKSVHYLANTVKVYREVMDHVSCNMDQIKRELNKAVNRGFTTGFLFDKEQCEEEVNRSHNKCCWEFCGEVVYCRKLNYIKVKVHNQILLNDELEFLVPIGKNIKYKVKKIFNEKFEEIKEAHGGQKMVIYLPVKEILPVMTLLRRNLKK